MLTRQQILELLQKPRRVHFIGVCGCGMSGLAKILIQLGHTVSGSDACLNGAGDVLRAMGAKIFPKHAAKNLNGSTDLIVYSTAIPDTNPELQAARERGIPVVRRAQLLIALMSHEINIAVAGTHGKTTTSAMLAHVLESGKLKPSFCIGADVPDLGTNGRLGAGKIFVAEADESDGTLIGFSPEYAIVLNIEGDHLDHYGSMQQLHATFETFAASVHHALLVCADDPIANELKSFVKRAVTFGFDESADYRAVNFSSTPLGAACSGVADAAHAECDVACRGHALGRLKLRVPGRQNVQNALAAVAMADELGVPFDKISAALATFSGARRRFERKFERDGVLVVDDYAHHPTEVRATLDAARTLMPQRIIAVFQPHRYTRTLLLREQFADAFAEADELFITDIYGANETPIAGIDGRAIFDSLQKTERQNVTYEPNFDAIVGKITEIAASGDLILTIGAGDVHKIADKLASNFSRLAANWQKRAPFVAKKRDAADEVRAVLSAKAVLRANEPMARHTSLRVGGRAQLWCEPWDEQDLVKTLQFCRAQNLPVIIIGRGTNLLVKDSGISGMVVKLSSPIFSEVRVSGERIVAGAAARLRAMVNAARQNEITGLEFMEGIPGSLGGALRMNAGAMGRQTFDIVETVRFVTRDGEIAEKTAAEMGAQYRRCPLLTANIALGATLRGERGARREIDARLREFAQKRWGSQPAQPSAGCIWKNPPQVPAGKLIEELGLKGKRIGGARVSDVHANFIVNEGGATANDVLNLMAEIREVARRERGIELEPEVVILGD
jgi:UDP-N-acetylmuramate--alanine ligase